MAVSHVKSITVADFTGTVTAFNSQGSTTTVAASDLGRPSDWNSAHNQFFTLTGNTTNASTASGTNVVLSGAGGIVLGGSTGTIVISALGGTVSGAILAPKVQGQWPSATTNVGMGQNSIYFAPFELQSWLSADHIRMPVSIQHSSSAASSGRKGVTFDFGLYSRHSTNQTLLTQHYSTSWTCAASISSNVSMAHSAISAIVNSTSYATYTSSSAGLSVSSILHSNREAIMPLSSVLSPGQWWMALKASTSGSGTPGNVLNFNNFGFTFNTWNRLGQAVNATNSGFLKAVGMGTYSATTGALPASVSMTQINQAGSGIILHAATGTV